MRFSTLVGASLLSAVLPLAATAAHAGNHARRHHDLAARNAEPSNGTEVELEKRGFSGRFTFYDVGLGACGKVNVPSDFIVALNSTQYGGGYPGPNCFRPIHITYNGKSADAVIMDECPGCPYGGLDFSRGLFDHFASEDVGVLYGQWEFTDGQGGGGGGGGGGNTQQSSTKKTSTHKDTPTPDAPAPSHTTEHTTTTTRTTTSTSTKTSTSTRTTTTTSTLHYNVSKGPVSGLAIATGALAPSQATSDSIHNLNQAAIGLGALINAGALAN